MEVPACGTSDDNRIPRTSTLVLSWVQPLPCHVHVRGCKGFECIYIYLILQAVHFDSERSAFYPVLCIYI